MDEPPAVLSTVTIERLLVLERALARRDPSGVGRGLAELVADDFVEVAASGRVWRADEIRAIVASDPQSEIELLDASVEMLAPGVALVTYRTEGARPACRASVWVLRDRRWVIRYHQGTPVAT